MKAAFIKNFGGPEVLEFGEMPMPEPKDNEILVKNEIIGLGKPDYLVRTGNYPNLKAEMPVVIGNESAGEVVGIGKNVKRFKVGDKVVVLDATAKGSHGEFRASDEKFAFKISDGVMPSQVPGLLNMIVSYILIFECGRMGKGKSLYIEGAAGGLGTTLIQMAHSEGIKVIASASTAEKIDVLKKMGADIAFNYKEKDIKEEVLNATNGEGVDVMFDQLAGPKLRSRFDYVKNFGDIVIYNWIDGDPKFVEPDTIVDASMKALAIRPFSFHVYDTNPNHRVEVAEKCFKMVKEGKVKPLIYKEFKLSEVKAAHELLDSGKAIGKIVMKP